MRHVSEPQASAAMEESLARPHQPAPRVTRLLGEAPELVGGSLENGAAQRVSRPEPAERLLRLKECSAKKPVESALQAGEERADRSADPGDGSG